MWRTIVYIISGILQVIILILMIRETRKLKKLQKTAESLVEEKRMTDDKPKSLKLSGWNKGHKLIFYECPICECPYNNVYFRKNCLRPDSIFKCDLCNAKLSVPDYERFKYE